MKRRTVTRHLLVAGAVSYVSRLFGSQDFVLRSDVRLVLLDVSVKDQHGTFVDNLTRENFRILENGVPQPVTVFDKEDAPVTLGLLVDESGSMTPKRNEVLAAAGALIGTSNPRDEIFVLNFNDSVKPGLPAGTLFSDDAAQLRAALYRGVPTGRTALHDAVVDGLQQLDLGRRARKALVVISDGRDTISLHSRVQMMAAVENSLATIYTIGLFDSDQGDSDPGILRRLAGVTGGESFFPGQPSGMTAVCRRIAQEIRQRYTLGYAPLPENHGALRHIQVRVSAPGRSALSALTRTRYRYDQHGDSNHQ
jgi:Ca-activated chloride channel family protein